MDVPYIPGFLAFREVPHVMKLLKRNKVPIECILVDGNGILHNNGCGFASYLGVLINIPTIGVSKKFFDVDGLKKSKVTQMFD